MPEIAEVYRACSILRRAALGKRIVKVDTIEDDIVFVAGASAFKDTVDKQAVDSVERYGKHFFMTLSNKQSILFHLGMSGHVQIRGEAAAAYRRKPKDPTLWPPKYWRFVLTFDDNVEFAFMDSRRFGRIKILQTDQPRSVAPLNSLGFDAISNMATLDQFAEVVRKRKCPIKALLLNQKFLAGVGNWVADEILYQSKVHPAQVCKTLSDSQIQKLYDSTILVCRFAVSVNADHTKFPQDWLFKYRWGKSHAARKRKRQAEEEDVNKDTDSDSNEAPDESDEKKPELLGKSMTRADGKVLNIEWITCGGRTSAFVVDEQILPELSTTETDLAESALEATPAKADKEAKTQPRVKKAMKKVNLLPIEAKSVQTIVDIPDTNNVPARRRSTRLSKKP